MVAIAHERTTKNPRKTAEIHKEEYRAFLMHLYVFSVLWKHFHNADNWTPGFDVGNRMLNLDEFSLACRTISGKNYTQEQIATYFGLLDVNGDQSISFLEV